MERYHHVAALASRGLGFRVRAIERIQVADEWPQGTLWIAGAD